jgi:CubicO group peptidase (beta-lactamase class C family)
MKRFGFLFLMCLPSVSSAQQTESFNYWQYDASIVWRGVETMMVCNGVFTSERSLDLIFEQELAYTRERPGYLGREYVTVDRNLSAVSIGDEGFIPTMRAAFRDGFGCIILPPNQDFSDIDRLPELRLPPAPNSASKVPWPDGDLVEERALPPEVDQDALADASDWAFDRKKFGTEEQVTLSVIVLYKGRIILERYAPGVDMTTRTRTWSTAKSIAATLVGTLVDAGKLSLDEPLNIEWLPKTRSVGNDPRSRITLRHVLNMSSGLYPSDNGLEYATGSGLSYWAGASSVRGARSRALIREPGTNWDYENYDNLLAVYAMKRAIGNDQEYLKYPWTALFDRIGMRNTFPGVDRFGDFIMSSQIYTNARDLARFGLLYLQNGTWNGERIVSEDWIEFERTPAPSTVGRGSFYGGQWWLVPTNRSDVPSDAYSTAGNRGQYVVVVPSHDVVIVRRGLDYGRQGFNRWDLTREVLRAIPPK